MLCDVVSDVLVLPGHGHHVDERVPRLLKMIQIMNHILDSNPIRYLFSHYLLTDVTLAVQEPHQQREDQKVAVGPARVVGGGGLVLTAAVP